MQEAQFYKTHSNKRAKCLLCPHACIIEENNAGKCNIRINKDGKLYSKNYGKATGLHAEPVEKKPLYHFYPGQQIVSVGTYGCNLRCDFCQNYHMSQAHVHNDFFSNDISTDRVVKQVLNSSECCGMAYTFNEPVVWYEYMLEIAEKVKNNGFANAVVSNGYINPKPLEKLINLIDGFNIDLKAFTDDFYRKYTGATLEPVKKTLKTIRSKNIHLEVTNLIIPGLNDDIKIFKTMVNWIADELGPQTPLHLSRYFPSYKMNIAPTPIKTIVSLREIAMDKLYFVYCGNVSSSYGGSDTVCPKCKTKVIERADYKTYAENLDFEGKCNQCKYKIAVC